MLAFNNMNQRPHNEQIAQRQIFLEYRKNRDVPLGMAMSFRDAGFRVYSQVDEDGLLLYLFSLIGFTNRTLVDIAFATPEGANTTNLLCNWGFNGLLLEGDAAKVEKGREFFKDNPDTFIVPPTILQKWVTVENFNSILLANGISGEIDLFSLDVDGNDYWIWDKLTAIHPRVVIVEAQTCWGRDRAVSIPYQPAFNRFAIHLDYFGASVPAFMKLARKKGYRPVACNRFGFNIIFVRQDIPGAALLPEISTEECFRFETPELQKMREEKLREIMGFEWIEV